jgi:hypothetical protein
MKTYLFKIIFVLALVTLSLTGCKTVNPVTVSTDRMDYGQVIAESWKRQTLLNVVRLRYADAPVFLEITSIINSRTVEGNVNAGAGAPGISGSGIDVNVGGYQTWTNSPTVSYQPVIGEEFTKSLLQPVPPAAVFQLIQGGWPVDLVLGTVVSSINGLRNASAGLEADSTFRDLVKTMAHIQRVKGLGFRVVSDSDRTSIIVVMPADETAPIIADKTHIRELLGLDPDARQFEVVFGLTPMNRQEVAMISRSMLELMLQLGFGIDLPPEHIAEGRVLPGYKTAGDTALTVPLAHIHSGLKEPVGAYTAVHYRNYWYWIEDTDVPSKRLFTFLMILFSLAQNGQTYAGPLVTVPSR